MFASVNLLTNSEKIFLVNFFRLRTCKQCEKAAYTLLRTKTRKFDTNIPRKGIARSQSQFPHSCVRDLFIYFHDRSAAGNIWTDPGNIAHRDMNVKIRTEEATTQFPEKEYINGISLQLQCSIIMRP